MPTHRATHPLSATLTGRVMRLEPLAEHHAEPLARAVSPDLLGMLATGPRSAEPAEVRAYVVRLLERPATIPFAAVHAATGEAVGVSNYFLDPKSETSCEIGGTWLATRLHGSAANPEMKLLMLSHALDTLGFTRVQFMADSLNTRSLRALAHIGARVEGTLRRHIPVRDAEGRVTRVRDSVVHSITDQDWMMVRPALEGLVTRRLDGMAR